LLIWPGAAHVLILLAAPLLAGAGAPSPPTQQTRLTLPFAGIWGVIQGFDSGQTHIEYAAFALDFVPAQPKSDRAPPRGAPLSAFACYGRPILAPADGIVVRVSARARDWPAYVEGSGDGNFVIIQHAENEFSELRHLQANSVTVAAGQRVRRGQIVGRCGNSGNAKTPHLHIALLSSVAPIATRRFAFSGYEVLTPSGRFQPGDGELRAGQLVRNAGAARAAAPERRP
jgi:murein DD-endopeptidase MepM/ murein hydrolase activator NlpD